MYIDNYKTLVMEHVSWPGNIGDSCAETARYKHLKQLLGQPNDDVDLMAFVTEKGFTRHPTAPAEGQLGPKEDGSPSDSWRETDMPTDQMLPLYLASDAGLKNLILMDTRAAGWRTGNGDLVSPQFFGLLNDYSLIVNVSTVGQAMAFKLPWRWSDAYNRFEEMENSSADYLNYIHVAVYAEKPLRNLVLKSTLKQKVRDYYKVEPNSQFLIDLYDQVIDKYF
jgi:hypothetical protein